MGREPRLLRLQAYIQGLTYIAHDPREREVTVIDSCTPQTMSDTMRVSSPNGPNSGSLPFRRTAPAIRSRRRWASERDRPPLYTTQLSLYYPPGSARLPSTASLRRTSLAGREDAKQLSASSYLDAAWLGELCEGPFLWISTASVPSTFTPLHNVLCYLWKNVSNTLGPVPARSPRAPHLGSEEK